MPVFTLRRFRTTDLPGVRSLHDRTPPDGQPYTGQVQRWPDELDNIPRNYFAFWVVTEGEVTDERIVGMTGLKDPGDEVPTEVLRGRTDIVRLESMRVAVERQRQGIGRLLVEAALAFARVHGWNTMILETTPQQLGAVALYEATGFREVGRSKIEWEGVWFNQIWFEQLLLPPDPATMPT